MADSNIEENPEEKELSLSSKKQEELVHLILEDYQNSMASRNEWVAKQRRGLNLYYGLKPQKDFPFPNCANIHVPLIKTIQSTLESNIIGSLDYDKPVSVLPVGPEDFDRAKAVERLLNWQLTSQVDYRDFIDKLIHSTLLYGHSFVKIRYIIEKEDGRKVYDGLRFDIPNPENVLFPPDTNSDNIEDWDYVIHELFLSLSDLKRRENSGFYKNIDKVSDFMSQKGGSNGFIIQNEASLSDPRTRYSGIEPSTYGTQRKSLQRILEWYGYFDINDDGVEESVLITISPDAKIILRCVQWSGIRPFVLFRFSPIAGKVVGESVPTTLAEINDELNTLHNQRVDAVTITNIPFFFFDPMAGFNPNQVQLVPGLGIPVNGSPTQAVYFPSLSTVKPEMYREEEILNLYAERLMGSSANTQGVIQPKRVSATEIAAIDRRSGIRFLTILNRMKTGLRRLFDIALGLNQEYLSNEVKIRIVGFDVGVKFDTLLKKDIQGNFDISINGNSIVDDQAEKSDQLQVYQMSLLNPLIMRDEIALYEVTKDTFSKLGVKRVDAYLRQPSTSIPKMPSEEHNILAQGEDAKPNPADNHELHIKEHEEFIMSDTFKLLSRSGQEAVIRHLLDTKKMYNVIQQLQTIQKLQAVNSQILQLHSGMSPMGMGEEGGEQGNESTTRGRKPIAPPNGAGVGPG